MMYGVSFVNPAFDWYYAWVPVIIYAMSYYIGPSYNSTCLYYRLKSYIMIHRYTILNTAGQQQWREPILI